MREGQAVETSSQPIYPVSRRHLEAMAGALGIFQHAIGSRPDPAHGYCVDDVARALQVDLLHARSIGWARVVGSAERNLAFLEAAFDERTGGFRNFRDVDGVWAPERGSNDSFGRAMLALGETVAVAPDARLAERAEALFSRALPAAAIAVSPRAQASIILGCAAVAASRPTATPEPGRTRRVPRTVAVLDAQAVMLRLATGIHVRFLTFARPGWPWPEATVTYENALLPRALIVAGTRLGATTMVRIGLQVLDWLIDIQLAPQGHLSPIGNTWWPRGGERSRFDQQPIEATALLLAAEAAFEATGQARYRAAMERAYGWFLGANDLGRRVAHPGRGASADGLTPVGLNRNEGAESTLMWLMASEHIRALRAAGAREAAVRPLGSPEHAPPAALGPAA